MTKELREPYGTCYINGLLQDFYALFLLTVGNRRTEAVNSEVCCAKG